MILKLGLLYQQGMVFLFTWPQSYFQCSLWYSYLGFHFITNDTVVILLRKPSQLIRSFFPVSCTCSLFLTQLLIDVSTNV